MHLMPYNPHDHSEQNGQQVKRHRKHTHLAILVRRGLEGKEMRMDWARGVSGIQEYVGRGSR